MANDEIEIYEVRDDPAQAVSDAVSTDIKKPARRRRVITTCFG